MLYILGRPNCPLEGSDTETEQLARCIEENKNTQKCALRKVPSTPVSTHQHPSDDLFKNSYNT